MAAAASEVSTTCTCGNRYRLTISGNDGGLVGVGGEEKSSSSSPVAPTTRAGVMDMSFVHLETAAAGGGGGGGPPPSLPAKGVHGRSTQQTSQQGLPPSDDSRGSVLLGSPSCSPIGYDHGHYGFWGRYRYLRAVESAIEDNPEEEGTPPPPPLCLICVARVERALMADAERMEREVDALRDAVRDEEFRSECWKRALVEAVMDSGSSSTSSSIAAVDRDGAPASCDILPEGMTAMDLLNQQEDAFRREVAILRDAADRQEDEMSRLAQLQREQAVVIRNLRLARTALEEERNNVEVDARDFDSDHALLSRTLVRVQDQVDRLSSRHIRLPLAMFDLSVDKDRGLRYPLINDLRLAYRPKGDVHWDEIQGAWSLAAQMLLSVATVFNFQSKSWKIVPLSHCAKLIYTEGGETSSSSGQGLSKATTVASAPGAKTTSKAARTLVFNLGHARTDGSRALLAWNALLHAVIQHATVQLHKAVDNGILESASILPSVPFAMPSPGQIGDAALARINPKDDAAWSKAIHRMSANLLWLSECASIYVHQATVLQAVVSAAATASTAMAHET